MADQKPHFLLYSEVEQPTEQHPKGRWRIVLEPLGGGEKFEASADEKDLQGERLHLLAIVRGLEALDQPSQVTLVTSSRYVSRGLRYGLTAWRENGWTWERFGRKAPVKNCDLWRRVDRALQYHRIECHTWRFDEEKTPETQAPTTRDRAYASLPPRRDRQSWIERLLGWMAPTAPATAAM